MKLRATVLLGVGILFLAMVITIYILPAYLVHKDIIKASNEIHELFIHDHQRIAESQKIWLKDVLERVKMHLDSLLLMIYKDKDLTSKLIIEANQPLTTVWDTSAMLAGFNPLLGFIQSHSIKENRSAVLTPYAAQAYPLFQMERKEGNLYFVLSVDGKKETFAGLKLPDELQPGDNVFTFYALVKPHELASLTSEFTQKVSPPEPASRENIWASKIDMIRMLGKILEMGVADKSLIPQGIVRADAEGNGIGYLSRDVFHETPIFDDKRYFETHLPKNPPPELANGIALITDNAHDLAYIANTLFIDSTYITIGQPLIHITRQLALSSNKTILLKVNDDFWIGFDNAGKKVPISSIEKFIRQGLHEDHGILNIEGEKFLYSRLSTEEAGSLVFYTLQTLASEHSIVKSLIDLERELSRKISLQLSLVALAAMILVLLFIGRIGLRVIQPVTKLAQSMQEVVKGHYQDVKIPDVGKRKDEIATLTHAFDEMVKGLEEREKIRGVLDKVVSKDVADEILRTKIHLGGEDRVVTMLFSDIRGFTHLTAEMSPQNTIKMLNACMTKISRVIEGEGGIIDKYVGDEVMALYGAPTLHPDHALRAVSSGLLIIETLKKWNLERTAAALPVIEMGIGVHTGLVVVGNMGAEDRLNYTVLGAHVNMAARLCEVAHPNQLLISEATLAEPNIASYFYTKALTPISLKGFDQPVQVYEVTGFKWS